MPGERQMHSVVVHENGLYVFGGCGVCGPEARTYGDFYKLDLSE